MQPVGHHLAQLNVARLVAAKDDARVADFMNNLDRINGLGKRMPGFVWLLEGESGPDMGATELVVDINDPLMMPNLSVWETVDALQTFVFDTLHKQFMNRKAEWFEVLEKMYLVMWWVPIGHKPSLPEAVAKLDYLNTNGDSDQAFGWSYLNKPDVSVMTGRSS
tara:strand:+ start:122 stop:613 length:492 start_codon:yes stop_codon:yes gene_type:complete